VTYSLFQAIGKFGFIPGKLIGLNISSITSYMTGIDLSFTAETGYDNCGINSLVKPRTQIVL